MPVSRSHLTRPKPQQVIVDLGEGDSLNVVFDANRITPAWMRDSEQRDSERDSYSLPKALAEVILQWDVTEDDGSPFEPSADNIGVLSYPAQTQLLVKILEAATPSSEEGNVSTNISAMEPAASTSVPEIHQNGPTPSPLPQPSTSQSPT